MPARALMGMETEYAVTGIAHNGTDMDRGLLIDRMFAIARRVYPHVRDCGSGLFLANGARLYLDRGHHPEFATPECTDPWEVVRYLRAGEAMLLDLAERLKAERSEIREISIFRHNVEYDRSGTTWGCHESYLHRRPPRELPAHLVPHFVTRIIYAGAGGFHPMVPAARFTLSPRAYLLPNVTAADSTGERGIFHIREESLASFGWHRMHVICGEGLCSELATILKLGTTALILAMVEAGGRPGAAVRLQDPVLAIRTVSGDPEGRAGLLLENGDQLSANEIQWLYLTAVEGCNASDLPPWAGDLCRLWRAQLIALDARDPSLDRTLDWAIKRSLFQRWVRDRMDWHTVERAGQLLERIERTAERLFAEDFPIGLQAIIAGEGSARSQLDRLKPLVAAERMTWEDLRLFFRLRSELYEIDARFGQLGEAGVFEQLDRAGVLAHRVTQPSPDSDAVRRPPQGEGRAQVRGQWIERLWRQGAAAQYRGDWTGLWNEITGRSLNLSDPYATTAEWQAPKP